MRTAIGLLALLALAGCGDEPTAAAVKVVTAPQVARDVIARAEAAHGAYPLETCVVSGDRLGSMGEAVVFVHEGQEVRLCCGDCRKPFDADPAKYLAMIEAAKAGK